MKKMTMELIKTIDADIKKAMLARDSGSLAALRNIKAALLLAKTEEGAGGQISRETELKVLQKLARQRKESAEIYRNQERADLEKTELDELGVIERYLPKRLEPEELEAELKEIIQESGAASPKDMGKVMGLANQRLAGRAEGKMIADTVRKLLSEGT